MVWVFKCQVPGIEENSAWLGGGVSLMTAVLICRWLTSHPPAQCMGQLNRFYLDHSLRVSWLPYPFSTPLHSESLCLSLHVASFGKYFLTLASGSGGPSVGSHGALQFPPVVSCCLFCLSSKFSDSGDVDYVCPEAGPGARLGSLKCPKWMNEWFCKCVQFVFYTK